MDIQLNLVEKSTKNPCRGNDYPFKSDKCNQIWAGAVDAEQYMKSSDTWELNWINMDSFKDLIEREDASDGDLLFLDKATGAAFFKLQGFFVEKERVTKIIRLILKYKFSQKGGEPGYIVNDPQDDEDGEWYSLSALQQSQFRSKFGVNPLGSPLAAIMGYFDSLIDDLLPDVANLIPWQAYVGAAAYTAIKTKRALPPKPTLKTVKMETIGYGAATGYLLFRAQKSYNAKKLREEAVIVGYKKLKK